MAIVEQWKDAFHDVTKELAPPVVDDNEDAKFPALIELATLDSEGKVAITMNPRFQ